VCTNTRSESESIKHEKQDRLYAIKRRDRRQKLAGDVGAIIEGARRHIVSPTFPVAIAISDTASANPEYP